MNLRSYFWRGTKAIERFATNSCKFNPLYHALILVTIRDQPLNRLSQEADRGRLPQDVGEWVQPNSRIGRKLTEWSALRGSPVDSKLERIVTISQTGSQDRVDRLHEIPRRY